MTKLRKLPIGIQDFQNIRVGEYLYVDKTALVYRLVSEGAPYFLARPRRFGKSLLLSTLKYYFEGRRELFSGLAIEKLEAENPLIKWDPHPVFHIDFNPGRYDVSDGIESQLNSLLHQYEDKWGKDAAETTFNTRFAGVIRRAAEKSRKQAVVLIDEYDKPLVDTMDAPEMNDHNREVLRSFYGVLKSSDQYLRFYLLTGITKFSQVSVFSQLNQLRDITLNPDYATLCGITEDELLATFTPELEAMAVAQEETFAEIVVKMRRYYNGYRFCEDATRVYNPFGTLNALSVKKFLYTWFQTGTPTFLVEMLRSQHFDLRDLADNVNIAAPELFDYRVSQTSAIPLLYQTGYLTILDYHQKSDRYRLGFPNGEVKYGFLHFLLPFYTKSVSIQSDFDIGKFRDDLWALNLDQFMQRMRAFFSMIPYDVTERTEKYYQSMFYVIFTLIGQHTQAELRSAAGRADLVVTLDDAVMVFEFKLAGAGTAEEALAQIDDKGYLIQFSAGNKKLIKIGAEFDDEHHTVGRYLIVQ